MTNARRQKQRQPRKTPRQARSQRMNDDLLAGAARVLQRDGAESFTTRRVADVTGVSIGSLYQYYPNKAALLLQLHQRDAEAAWRELAALLDEDTPMSQRLERFLRRFLELLCDGHEHHRALHAVGVVVSATPEFIALEARAVERFEKLLTVAAPGPDHAFSARFLVAVLVALGERLSTRPVSPAEREQFTVATVRMLRGYLGL